MARTASAAAITAEVRRVLGTVITPLRTIDCARLRRHYAKSNHRAISFLQTRSSPVWPVGSRRAAAAAVVDDPRAPRLRGIGGGHRDLRRARGVRGHGAA